MILGSSESNAISSSPLIAAITESATSGICFVSEQKQVGKKFEEQIYGLQDTAWGCTINDSRADRSSETPIDDERKTPLKVSPRKRSPADRAQFSGVQRAKARSDSNPFLNLQNAHAVRRGV